MKKIISIALVTSVMVTMSVSALAMGGKKAAPKGRCDMKCFKAADVKMPCKDIKACKKDKIKLDEATLAKIKAANEAFCIEATKIKEKIKALNADLKTAKSAQTVDEAKIKEIKNQLEVAQKELKEKSSALKKTIDRIMLVAKYGEDAVVKLEAAEAAYKADISPLKKSVKALMDEFKSAYKAQPVDKAKIKEINDKIFAANKSIMEKTKAYEATKKNIIDVAIYGAEAVAKMDAAKVAFKAEEKVINEKIQALMKEKKALKETKPVDEAKLKELRKSIMSLQMDLNTKKKALNDTINSIIKSTKTVSKV